MAIENPLDPESVWFKTNKHLDEALRESTAEVSHLRKVAGACPQCRKHLKPLSLKRAPEWARTPEFSQWHWIGRERAMLRCTHERTIYITDDCELMIDDGWGDDSTVLGCITPEAGLAIAEMIAKADGGWSDEQEASS